MILAIDAESSGLPARGMALTDPGYPWPCQVAAVLFNFDGHDQAVFSTRIRSEGRAIGAGAQNIHGISSREAAKTGIPEVVALSAICHFASQALFIVGFSVEFDRDVLHAAILRLGQDPKRLLRPGLQLVDLMKPSAAYVQSSSGREDGAYRWPKLSDALGTIRHERPAQGRHDALDDARKAKRLFLSLHHRGALDLPEAA